MKLIIYEGCTGPDDGRTPLTRAEVRELFRRKRPEDTKGERLISFSFRKNPSATNELPYTRNLTVYDVIGEFTEIYHH